MDIYAQSLSVGQALPLTTVPAESVTSRELFPVSAQGKISGSEALCKLLRHVVNGEDTYESSEAFQKAQMDPNLMDLLHPKYASLMFDQMYGRGESTIHFFLNSLWDKHLLRSQESSDIAVQFSTTQNQQLAIKGLTILLDDTKNKSDNVTEITSANSSSDVIQSPGESSSNLSKRQTSSSESGMIMLLPLLTDYIKPCVDVMHSSSARRRSYSSLSCYSCFDYLSSGFDSLTTPLGQFPYMKMIYTRSTERSIKRYAVTALRCLVIMIRLGQEVGHTIIANYTNMTASSTFNAATCRASTSSYDMPVPDQQSKGVTYNLVAFDNCIESSSEMRNASNHTQPCLKDQVVANSVRSTLLHLVLKLADSNLEDHPADPDVVKLSLTALTSLCQYCDEEYLPKLEVIITRGILTNCFSRTKHISILIYAQRLLVSLTKSDKLLARVCTKSQDCPLYLMHQSCLIEADGVVDLYMEYITSLSRIKEHRSGLQFLVSNKCPCSDEMVTTVIIVLCNLFEKYEAEKVRHKNAVLRALIHGINLIKSLAAVHKNFAEHEKAVRWKYVQMLSGLLTVMRSDPQTWQFHLPEVEKLTLSQTLTLKSEEEIEMVQFGDFAEFADLFKNLERFHYS